jgi:diadenosine tetraphosphate (Ap4A) HIT family hydrolase
MLHDPSCFYCVPDQRLADLMIEVARLEVSTLFLFREQTHRGRCLVAFREHARELFDLAPEELAAFGRDLARAARAVQTVVAPDKLNYGAYADKLGHLHFHLVPKVQGGRGWGGTFEMVPEPRTLLTEAEYEELAGRIRAALPAP